MQIAPMAVRIGRVSNASLNVQNSSYLLYTQLNINQCICTAILLYNSTLLALNYFSSNQSCQVILLPISSYGIVSSANSTLIIFQTLPNRCCSDLSFVLKSIQLAQQPASISITQPVFLSISPANNLLSVMSYYGSRTLFNRSNLNVSVGVTSVGSQCAIAAQSENLFVSSCDTPHSIRIYNDTIYGSQLLYVLNATYNVRQVVFTRNYTWLLVINQYLKVVQFYAMDLQTNMFIYNYSIPIPYAISWSLTRYNDTLIYLCFWEFGIPVYILSLNNSVWAVSNLPQTKPSSSQVVAQVAFDSCNRLWTVVYGYGIKIYDLMGQTLLASWSSVSTTLSTLLILDNYEIFLGDYDNNYILHYTPNLQCTL
ncbi:unnamed protein product [Adineta ricciae]|uniref:Uncharacterized protein n=1 Tax=Adineta ricciae TaxID=249248 RepID=A0A815M410_ADIRI|nr:unnamed protein product [Adineta ricciae]CAF1417203.1 unnamed protein product [Adineta ricciae]